MTLAKLTALIDEYTEDAKEAGGLTSHGLAEFILEQYKPAVKPLDWGGVASINGDYFINSIIKRGKFCVIYRNGDTGGNPIANSRGGIWFDTVEEAKARAQSHRDTAAISSRRHHNA